MPHHVILHCSSSMQGLCVCVVGGAVHFCALSGPLSTLLRRGTVYCSASQADWSAVESRLILAPWVPGPRLRRQNMGTQTRTQ